MSFSNVRAMSLAEKAAAERAVPDDNKKQRPDGCECDCGSGCKGVESDQKGDQK